MPKLYIFLRYCFVPGCYSNDISKMLPDLCVYQRWLINFGHQCKYIYLYASVCVCVFLVCLIDGFLFLFVLVSKINFTVMALG